MRNEELYTIINNIDLDDPEYKLDCPFDVAMKAGDSIDYKLVKGSSMTDHTLVKKLGFETKESSDCSYYVEEIPWFSFSSYGDWGTIFVGNTNVFGKKLFLYMCHEGIVKPWRIRVYVRRGDDTISYDYNDEGKNWKMYEPHGKGWQYDDPPKHYNLK